MDTRPKVDERAAHGLRCEALLHLSFSYSLICLTVLHYINLLTRTQSTTQPPLLYPINGCPLPNHPNQTVFLASQCLNWWSRNSFMWTMTCTTPAPPLTVGTVQGRGACAPGYTCVQQPVPGGYYKRAWCKSRSLPEKHEWPNIGPTLQVPDISD